MHKLSTSILLLALAATAHAQTGQDTQKIRKAADAAVASADWKTAIASFQQLVQADPKDGKAWHMLGYSLHSNGDLDEALKAHIKATAFKEVAPIASYNAACVFALRGKKQDALNWLAKAAEAGFDGAEHMSADSDMDSLRDELRYKELVTQIEKNASEPRVQVYAGNFDRKMTRVVLFAGKGSIGGVSISYGQPKWQEKYDQAIKSPKFQDQRWRFGKDEWTTLDTSVPLTLGDQQLPAGVYYLTVARRGSDFVLAALDPTTVHKHTIDPYLTQLTTGGTEVVLKHDKLDQPAELLEIELVQTAGTQGAGELVARFGPHKLAVPFALQAKTK